MTSRIVYIRFYDVRAYDVLASILKDKYFHTDMKISPLQSISSFDHCDMIVVSLSPNHTLDEDSVVKLFASFGMMTECTKKARNRLIVRYCDERVTRQFSRPLSCEVIDGLDSHKENKLEWHVVDMSTYHHVYFKLSNPFKIKQSAYKYRYVCEKENIDIYK